MNPIQYTLQTLVRLDVNKTNRPTDRSSRMAAAKKFEATIAAHPMPVEYSSGLIAILEFIYYLFNGTEAESNDAVNDNAALVLDALQSPPNQWHSICDSKGNTVQIRHDRNTVSFRLNEADQPLEFTASAERFAEELRNNIPIRPEFTAQTRALTVLLGLYKELSDNDPTMEGEPDENLLLQSKDFQKTAVQILALVKQINLDDPLLINNSGMRAKILYLEKTAKLGLEKLPQLLSAADLHDATQSEITDQLHLVSGENGLPADLNAETTKKYLDLTLQTEKLIFDIEKNGLTASEFARFNQLRSAIYSSHTEQNQADLELQSLLILCEKTVENAVVEIIADVTNSLPKDVTIYSSLITVNMPTWLEQYERLPDLISESIEDNVQFIVDILTKKIDAKIRDIARQRSAPDDEPSVLSDELPVGLAETPITVDEVRQRVTALMSSGLPNYDKLDELIADRLQLYGLLQTPLEDDPSLELP